MKIAITGGTGFVGRTLARALVTGGHQVVLVARGFDGRDMSVRGLAGARFCPIGLDDPDELTRAFEGCEGVAHCAGINREIGSQTYRRVHIEGTQNVVKAAEQAGASKVALLSFLRARPHCGSGYHESKWAAEEIVRECGLDYTILKAGVIYGRGDHMLDHLSHAFHTFPVFALVGFRERSIRPVAVAEVVRILEASLLEGALSRQTVAVTGPEQLTLREAVTRVAKCLGRKPWIFPCPVWFHYALAWVSERIMVVPLASRAQVRILSEGLTDASPPFGELPGHLEPKTPFSKEHIQLGLPPPGSFRFSDLRCCHRRVA